MARGICFRLWSCSLIINRLFLVLYMEKPCEECDVVAMTDSEHRICYDCFVIMDIAAAEEEE